MSRRNRRINAIRNTATVIGVAAVGIALTAWGAMVMNAMAAQINYGF